MELHDERGRVKDADKKRKSLDFMVKVLDHDHLGSPHPNVAEMLSEDERKRIGNKVVREYELDRESRGEWEEVYQKAMDLARQTFERKVHPWPNASNIKYPLITDASVQFASRAYQEICQDRNLVHCAVLGDDPDGQKKERAMRIEQHMSWQLLEEMEDWEEELDRLLHVLPVAGVCFRKTYFCGTQGRNRSDLCLPDDVVVHYNAPDLEHARRITHRFRAYTNEVIENEAAGIWLKEDLSMPDDPEHPSDEDAPHIFLEQHRWLDLDGDGYEEPWVVTVHEATGRVVRIVARFEVDGVQTDDKGKVTRIEPVQYWTKFGFVPAPDGSIYDLGFGHLMYPINAAVNTILNQLIDAGTLANTQGGWIDRKIRDRGTQPFAPGEWRATDTTTIGSLRDAIIPLPVKEPSGTLFSLLQQLIEAGREIGNLQDVLQGQLPGANTPASTVLAAVEQGLKRFTAIYKRLYRSLGSEFKKLYRLNGIYLDKQVYFRFLDNPAVQEVGVDDYKAGDMDVVPVADPNMSSEIQRMARVQAAFETLDGREGVDGEALTQMAIQALRVPNASELIIPPEERPDPTQDPMFQMEQQKLDMESQKIQLDRDKLDLEWAKTMSQAVELRARAVKHMADAEAAEEGQQIQMYMAQVQGMYQMATERMKLRQQELQVEKQQIEQQQQQQAAAQEQQQQAAMQQQGASNNATQQ
jgi:chaperonin GroES